MTTFLLILTAVLSYFIGNLNGANLFSRILKRQETEVEDLAPSLTLYHRIYGPFGVALIILADILKSLIAIALGGAFLNSAGAAAVGRLFAGFCLIMGHEFPVVNRYHGRSGILCGAVMALLVDWRVAFGCLVVFLLVIIFFRYLSLGAIAASLFCPIFMWMFTHETIEGTLALLCALLIIARYAENILNLIGGTEPRLDFRPGSSRSNWRY